MWKCPLDASFQHRSPVSEGLPHTPRRAQPRLRACCRSRTSARRKSRAVSLNSISGSFRASPRNGHTRISAAPPSRKPSPQMPATPISDGCASPPTLIRIMLAGTPHDMTLHSARSQPPPAAHTRAILTIPVNITLVPRHKIVATSESFTFVAASSASRTTHEL